MPDTYLGIDVGTSGIRINVIDAERNLLAEKQSKLKTETQPHVWWECLLPLIKNLPDSIRASIRSLSIDATSSTVFFCTKDGTPNSPVLWYNDSRATKEAKLLANTAPDNSATHGPGSSLAKILWLLDNGYQGDHIVHQADWLRGRLTNDYSRSDENNCLKLGYDVENRYWPEWLTDLRFNTASLPVVDTAGKYYSIINRNIASQLGLDASCKVVAGTTDSTAAFIATGASANGDAVTCLGSTLVLKLLSNKAVFSAKYGIYSHRIYNHWLVGGASNSGGGVLRHFFSQEELDQMTGLLQPDKPTGLNYYPLVRPGERFPLSDHTLEPVLTPVPENRVEFFQGLLEGITEIERSGYEILQQLTGCKPVNLYSTGGGSINPAWNKIRESRLEMNMKRAQSTQAAFGSAILASRW